MQIKMVDILPNEYKDCYLAEGRSANIMLQNDFGIHPVAVLVGPSVIGVYKREDITNFLYRKEYEKCI